MREIKTYSSRLRIGHFTQHHVDILDMEISAIELLVKNHPGEERNWKNFIFLFNTIILEKFHLLQFFKPYYEFLNFFHKLKMHYNFLGLLKPI